MKTNETILEERTKLFNKRPGVRVGDFLKLSNGKYLRFSHNWGNKVQTSGVDKGSFYFGNGYCEFSGSLYAPIDKSKLTQLDETAEGDIWIFNNNEICAHNGVYFKIKFRVFEITDKDAEKQYVSYIMPEEQ